MKSVLAGLLFLLVVPPLGAQAPQKPNTRTEGGRKHATIDTYPVGYRVSEAKDSDDPYTFYRDFYIRPRAYPETKIDERLRLRAYHQLQEMRLRLRRPHINVGWFNRPCGPGGNNNGGQNGAPGTTGPGGCAWTTAGPTNINGRITSIAIDSNNNQHIFAATVGGVYRSEDGGRTWERISDYFLAEVSGSVAINPSNGSEVFIGTGDPNYALAFGSPSGNGIWQSTSTGDPTSWVKVSPPGLDGVTIYRLRVDPAPPNNIYAATSSGVYVGTRTMTGITWSLLGGFDAWTSDIAVDFTVTPRLVYAGVGAGNASFGKGIWKYNGTSWSERDSGITTLTSRTISLALAASNTSVLYAKVEDGTTGKLQHIYKTTTAAEPSGGGGNAWSVLSAGDSLDDSCAGTFCYSWYNSTIEVDPNNANIVWAGGLNIWNTTNGGTTWNNVSQGTDAANYPAYVHSDHHAVAFDPSNSKIIFVGDDGGMFQSTDTSASAWHWNHVSHGMITAQFYETTSQQATATINAGGTQDNGTEITFGNRTWYQPGGCDGSTVGIDGVDSDTLYANCNGGLYELANPVPGTVGGGSTIPWTLPSGINIVPPLVTDPANAGDALSAGCTVGMKGCGSPVVLLKTTDGKTWTAASPTLAAGVSISAIGIAPSSSFQTYYIGILGGTPSVWTTTNGGTSWNTNPTGIPNLSPNSIAVDYTTSTRAVAAFGGGGGGAGGVYLTSDGGNTWQSLPGGGANALPNAPVLSVTIDPNDSNRLYIGTSLGPFVGEITPGNPPTASWTPFDEGLPDGLDVSTVWVNRTTGILNIGTFGHGGAQRDVRPGIMCPGAELMVRDNVFDRGAEPSPSGVPDAEHPIPDPSRPGFYMPDNTPAGQVFWWDSTDIRIDVPSADPPKNTIAIADHVELESCPIELSDCPQGTILDSNPIRGKLAKAYVQVTNQGLAPASNVRVIALYADASAGLPLLPGSFWSTTFPSGSTSCGALDTSTGWNLVDPSNPCQTIPVVNPELPEVVGFNWNVPATAADHTCLFVVVESADDPLDPNIRATNELRPWVLVPQYRHITNRNLHVITASSPGTPFGGMEPLTISNFGREEGNIDLVISRAGLGQTARLGILLPRGLRVPTLCGVKREPYELRPEERARAEKLGLDVAAFYSVTDAESMLQHIPLARGKTMKIGLVYEIPSPAKPNTAARFSIMERQGGVVLGGSTYIVRVPTAKLKSRVEE